VGVPLLQLVVVKVFVGEIVVRDRDFASLFNPP